MDAVWIFKGVKDISKVYFSFICAKHLLSQIVGIFIPYQAESTSDHLLVCFKSKYNGKYIRWCDDYTVQMDVSV